MSLNFNDIQVFVGGTGIWCQSASLSSANGSNPVSSLGFIGQTANANNSAVSHSVRLDYLLNTATEPIFGYLANLKDDTSVNELAPIPVNIGNVSGAFYLKSYNVSVQPNSVISANAEYQCFHLLSGSPSSKATEQSFSLYDFANSAQTNISGTQSSVYSLSYSADIDLLPVFSVGKQFPKILKGNIQERISLSHDLYTGASFNPDSVQSVLDIDGVAFHPIKSTYTNTGAYLELNVGSMDISSFSMSCSPNDIVRFSVEANRIS